MRLQPLPREFYERPVLEVARDLIGCVVTHGQCSGVIVETEAYHDSEPACHAYVGLTRRTATLFGPSGRAYVYLSYGVHALLNAVCEPQGVGAAVLIRALEPLDGIELMAQRRGVVVAPGDPTAPPAGLSAAPGGPMATQTRALCSGPGKLTQALGVTLADNGCDLRDGAVRIGGRPPGLSDPVVQRDRRIGITKATELPWRFCLAGSAFLSAPVRATA